MDEKEFLEINTTENTEVSENETTENTEATVISTDSNVANEKTSAENEELASQETFETEENIESVEELSETDNSIEAENDGFVYLDENAEIPETIENTTKSKIVIQKPIIIACCILLCAIIVFGIHIAYSSLFGNSVVGTWVSSQEIKKHNTSNATNGNGVTYFTFNRNGDVDITLGSVTFMGEWKTSSENSDSVEISAPYMTGTFTVKVEGNIFTGKSMTLKGKDTEAMKFISAKVPKMVAQKEKDAKTDKKIFGEWANESVGITYIIKPDNTYTINQYGQIIINGVYTIKDGKFLMTFISNEKTTTDVTYKLVDSNTLNIAGSEFKKVK